MTTIETLCLQDKNLIIKDNINYKCFLMQEAGQAVINKYLNLHVDGRVVATPFWMNNDPDLYGDLGRLSFPAGGKMSPEEINDLLKKRMEECSHQAKIDFSTFDQEEFRNWMRFNGIGMDCSGLVMQVCIEMARIINLKLIPGYLFNEEGFEIQRPSQVNVKVLTNQNNSRKLEWNEGIRPGDVISGLKKKHSMVVLSSDRRIENNGIIEKLICAQSSDAIESGGVSVFSIERRVGESIYSGSWSERRICSKSDEAYNVKFLQRNDQTDGVFRLKVFDNLC